MGLSFLSPVSEEVISFVSSLHSQSIGKQMQVHTSVAGLPDLEGVKIAFVGVSETRNASAEYMHPNALRTELYQLFPGNWSATMVDLGDIAPGAEVTDTYYALKGVVDELVKQQITVVVLGGSQDLTYAMYRGYDGLEQLVNMVTVDNRFDLVTSDEPLGVDSYMNSVIMEAPNNLHNFANIGYQSYYNSQESVDLMEKLFFDICRLGQVVSDVTVVEPLLRDADLVSIDMTAVQGADLGAVSGTYPNGFNAREICAIARYAGISDKVSSFGMFNLLQHPKIAQLGAQVLWYFIEGYNYRFYEYPFTSKEQYIKYIVPIEDEEELIFYKSHKSGRWWIAVPFFENINNNIKREALLPCTNKDYIDACNQIMPERWWKAYQKSMN